MIRPHIISIINESLLFHPWTPANHNMRREENVPYSSLEFSLKYYSPNKGKQEYYRATDNYSRELTFSLFQYVRWFEPGKRKLSSDSASG